MCVYRDENEITEAQRRHQARKEQEAYFKYVREKVHNIGWEGAEILQYEERKLVRNYKETRTIKQTANSGTS